MTAVHRFARHTVLFVLAVLTYRRALSAYFFDDDLQWLVGSWAFSPANLWALGRMDHFYRPTIDLYFAGAKLEAMYPLSIISDGIGLNVTIMSYRNSIDIGITADREQTPEVQTLVDGMQSELELLLAAARAAA